MKFHRELHIQASESGWVEFRAQQGNAVSESTLESELLPIIYVADPALDDATGRLLPGFRATSVAARLLVLGPDSVGSHYLGGITCTTELAANVARLAAERGYHVVGTA